MRKGKQYVGVEIHVLYINDPTEPNVLFFLSMNTQLEPYDLTGEKNGQTCSVNWLMMLTAGP